MQTVYQRSDLAAVYLPINQMLQIDRVQEISENSIYCKVDLTNHWVFPLHFPGDPIFPACLMIEAAGQAIAIWAWNRKISGNPRLTRVKASFTSSAHPADQILSLRAFIRRRKRICVGRVELSVQDRKTGEIEETLAWV